jgi:hypothetical protein
MKALPDKFAFAQKIPSQRHEVVTVEFSSRIMGGRVLVKPLEVTLHE